MLSVSAPLSAGSLLPVLAVVSVCSVLVVDPSHPLVGAALRVAAGVFAAVVIAVGFFDRSLRYALAVGLLVGVLYAIVAEAGSRLRA